MKDADKLKELEQSIRVGLTVFGTRMMEMESSVSHPCKRCLPEEEPKVIPTYFFYHKPHTRGAVGKHPVELGFSPALKK